MATAAIEKNFEYFLDNDFSNYGEGEWIAIYKNKVISHGKTLKRVMGEAKKSAPLSKILFSKVKKTAAYLQS